VLIVELLKGPSIALLGSFDSLGFVELVVLSLYSVGQLSLPAALAEMRLTIFMLYGLRGVLRARW